MLDARGMHVSAIGSPIGKVKITDDFGAHLERFRRAITVSKMLDTPHIRIFSFFIPAGEDAAQYRTAVMDRLLMLTNLAEDAGVTLWHENEKEIYGDIATRCADIHNTIRSPHLRAAFDPANFIQCGVRPMDEAWPLLADVSTHIHIKDAVMADGHVVPAGEGDGQVKELLHALVKRGYRGYLTLEPHLKAAGPSGGFSGPDLFHTAVEALKGLLKEVEGSKRNGCTYAMRFGCCGGVADAPLLRDAGFDYIELPVGTLMSATDEAAYQRIVDEILAMGLPVEACNVFIPGTLKITGPEVVREPLWQYAATALQRMGEIGVRVCVFGSGGARSIPEGFDREQALDQLAAFLDHVQEVSARHGVRVVIEPLNRGESNVFNSVAESDEFNRRAA